MAAKGRSAPVPRGAALESDDAALDALTTAAAMQALAAQAVDGGPPDALDPYVRAEPAREDDGA